MHRIPMVLAALCVWGSSALAADHPDIVQAGFSQGGHYHLLVTAYDADGSGFPVAALQITDVRRNTVAYSVRKTWDTDSGAVAPADPAAALLRSQSGVLARYGLSHPVAGRRLFVTPPLPMLAYPGHGTVTRTTAAGPLSLSQVPLPSGCMASDFPAHGFALNLGGRFLQRDTRLPASRQCASAYSLDTAWTYKNNLVVIVRSYTQAFEGPDVLPLVVTGRLKN